jgi:hypothetical protein
MAEGPASRVMAPASRAKGAAQARARGGGPAQGRWLTSVADGAEGRSARAEATLTWAETTRGGWPTVAGGPEQHPTIAGGRRRRR